MKFWLLAPTWIHLGNTLLSKISQTENIMWFHWYETSRVVKFRKAESILELSGEWKTESYCLMIRVSIGGDKGFRTDDNSNDSCILWIYLMPQSCTLQMVKMAILLYII